MLEFIQIGAFVAAAEEMHFGRAAVRLNMTQPTLSRHINALERTLRVRLFERANRTVKLTSAGRIFLPEAKRILLQAETATNLTRRAWRGEAGVVRLGFTATAAFADLPLILGRAAGELANIKILLKESVSAIQTDMLLSDMLDVAMLRPPIDRSKFNVLRIRREGFVAALQAQDKRAKRKSLTLKDFDRQPFVMYSVDGAGYSHRMLMAMFDQAGVAPVMTQHLDQNHSILSMVSAGMGAALVPKSLTLLQFPNVVFRAVETSPAEPLEMFLSWRPQNDNPALSSFIGLCRTIFSDVPE